MAHRERHSLERQKPSDGLLPSERDLWKCLSVSTTSVLVGCLLREAIGWLVPATALPFIFFFPSVAVAAWYGGLWQGLLSIVLSGAAATWFFIEPIHSFAIRSLADATALAAFFAASFIIVAAIESMHRARSQLAREVHERTRAEIALATTLGSIGDGVVTTDIEGNVTFLNHEAERLTGWENAQAVGRPLAEVFHIVNEVTREAVESPAEKALRLGTVVGLANHTVLISRQRTETPIDDSAAPIRASDGSLFGVVLVFRDVAERRRTQLAQARLAAIVEYSGDAIVTKNLDGVIQTWNRSAEELFGYKAEEIIGKHVSILIPPNRLDEEEQIIQRLQSGLPAERLETLRVAKDGRQIPVAVSVSPIKNAEGEVVGASKVVHDISALVAAREALQREKELLATTLASIGDAVMMTDPAGRVTYLNHAAEELTGWSGEDAIGRPLPEVFRIVNEERRQPVENPVDKVFRLGTVVGLANHTLLLRPDGTEVSIDDSAAPIRRPGQPLAGVVLVFRDATEHRRAHETSARLAAIVEFAGDAIVTQDLNGIIRTWNAGAERLFGYKPEEVIGKPITILFPPDRLFEEDEILDRLRRGQPSERLETLRIAKDGRELPVWVSVSPIRDKEGRVVGASRIVHDISDVVAARSAAEHAGRMKDEFLATLSHELRTPLSAVLGYATLLRSGRLAQDEHNEAVEAIERNARAQAQLIEDLLDMNRIVSGKTGLDIRPVQLEEVIEAALSTVRPSAQAKRIDLRHSVEGVAEPVPADPARLQQIIWNLLSNAVKFTPEGGGIDVSANRNDSRIDVSVRDTGEGIEPDFLPYVFDRFRQADATTTRRHGGLGLGLAIVRHLVELHGGTVRAESAGKGQGSTFTVSLPVVARLKEGAAPDRQAAPSALASESVDLSGVDMLVVDDEPDATALLQRVLQGHHAGVERACSVDEALAALARKRYDVLITDIGMPGRDGYELIAQLRAAEGNANQRIPAIAATAFAREEDRDRTINAGFQGHVVKPFDFSILLNTVARVLRSE
jgi:PAS domain S-box-containing protein